MRILITGSTGFVGRNLVPLLIHKFIVCEVTRDIKKSFNLFGSLTQKIDLSKNHNSFCKAVNKFNPEIVIHLASFITSDDSSKNFKNLIDSNLYFLLNLLDSVKSTKLKLFINTGTFAEFHNNDNIFSPAYLYAATKTASRSFLNYYSKTYSFKQITVTPYTIYGGNDSQKKIIDLIYDSLESKTKIDIIIRNACY